MQSTDNISSTLLFTAAEKEEESLIQRGKNLMRSALSGFEGVRERPGLFRRGEKKAKKEGPTNNDHNKEEKRCEVEASGEGETFRFHA